MKYQVRCVMMTLLFYTLHAKILRNNALLNKMISNFHQDNNLQTEPKKEAKHHQHSHHKFDDLPIEDKTVIARHIRQEIKQKSPDIQEIQDVQEIQDMQDTQDKQVDIKKLKTQQSEEKFDNTQPQAAKILKLMRNVLCKNFPTIPCKLIIQDNTLSKLIGQSIQEIAFKQKRFQQTTPSVLQIVSSPTAFPVINSEDLSNFLEVSNTGYFKKQKTEKKTKKKKNSGEKRINHWSYEKSTKIKIKKNKDTKHGTELYTGRKKIRKFYPHKIKYKDKINFNKGQSSFRDYVEEEKSISAEIPITGNGVGGLAASNNNHLAYKVEHSDSPVWRIDYMKHGVPSMNMFEYNDEPLPPNFLKTDPLAIHDDNGIEQSVMRKEVMHPDVYIKKSSYKNLKSIGSNIIPLENNNMD